MKVLPVVLAAALIPIGSALAHAQHSGEEQMERALERLPQHVAVLPAASGGGLDSPGQWLGPESPRVPRVLVFDPLRFFTGWFRKAEGEVRTEALRQTGATEAGSGGAAAAETTLREEP